MEADKIISELSKKGIKSEIIETTDTATAVVFEGDKFKQIESKSINGKGLRIINKDGKLGFSYCGGSNDSTLADFAIENSALGNKVSFDFPCEEVASVKGLYNKDVFEISEIEMKKQGEEIIDKIKSSLPEYKVDVEIEKEEASTSLANSSGFNSFFRKSYLSIYFSVTRAKDDSIFSADESIISLKKDVFYKEKLDAFIEKCIMLKNKGQIKTGKYPVIFTPKASILLYNILTYSFNGKNIQKGSSPLCGMKGKRMFSKNFTFSDAPLHPGGISSAPFDGEGSACFDKELVKDGSVENFIYDIQTASLMGEKTTGNGRRGYSSIPNPGFYNLVVSPGDTAYDNMLSGIKEGVLVDEYIGGGQSNVMAGEFNVNLTLAFKIENGKVTKSIKDTMLSGNVFEIFKNNPVFGNEIHQKANCYIPYLLADNLSLTS